MAFVIGIDIGGTFTDAFTAEDSGRIEGVKTPSAASPSAPTGHRCARGPVTQVNKFCMPEIGVSPIPR